MKKYQKVLGGLAVFTAATASGVALTAATQSADAQDFEEKGERFRPEISEEQKAEMQERREALETAIENNNYDAWKEVMDQRVDVTDVINEENFEQFAEMHQLMEEGEFEQAQEIRDELGLQAPHGGMGPRGHKSHRGFGFQAAQ